MKYKDAGVNIDKADKVVKIIGGKAKSTLSKHVLDGVGPFGAMFQMPSEGLDDPVLVSTIDGVGTKLKLNVHRSAFEKSSPNRAARLGLSESGAGPTSE